MIEESPRTVILNSESAMKEMAKLGYDESDIATMPLADLVDILKSL